jgi:antitoxin component YwqK of YwqJK toxin-antitoxin module
MVAAVAMFFYTRPEVIEDQPMPGFHLKRQVYRTEDNTPVNHGWWELRDADERLVCEGRYRNDQPSGQWVWRHASGRVRQQGEYRQGQRHGTWRTWHDDGSPQEEWTYADGTLEGPARTWWPSGHLASEGTYAAGRQSGEWAFYNDKGQQIVRGHYEDDRREGAWLGWDDSGNELPAQHYAAGRLVPDDKDLVGAWRQRLHGPGYAGRSEAAWALARLGQPGMAVLDEAAGSADAEIRRLAFLELVDEPRWAEANVPRLVAALDEESEQVQLAAMLALSPLGPRAEVAVPKLERLLADRTARDDAQSSSGSPASGNSLVPADQFPVCVLATLVSIVPERDDLVAKLVRAYPASALYPEAYDEIARYLARPAEAGLLKAVGSSEPEVRAAALATLGNAIRAGRFPTSAAAMQVLAEALGDGDATVRRQACDAIAAFGPEAKSLKPRLQAVLKDPDPEVAKAAENAIVWLDGGGAGFGGQFGGQAFGVGGFF